MNIFDKILDDRPSENVRKEEMKVFLEVDHGVRLIQEHINNAEYQDLLIELLKRKPEKKL